MLIPDHPDTRGRHSFPYDHGIDAARSKGRKYTGRHRAEHDDRCEVWAAGNCGCHLRAAGSQVAR